MQQENTKKTLNHLRKITKNKRLLPFLAGLVVLFVVLIIMAASGGESGRSESYKNVTGAAGLNASIAYDCKKNCDQKFNFNIYILREDGQQVSVVRPDNEGRVRLALPEDDYVMLIGKQIGKDKLFPQEKIALKNGRELELKLQYKEGGL